MNKDSYEFIIDKMIDGILILDLKGKITYANSAFKTLTGIPLSKAKDTNFKKYISEKTVPEIASSIFEAAKHKQIRGIKADLLHHTGKTVAVNCNFTPLIQKGKQTGIFVLIRDMRQQQALEKEKKRVKKASLIDAQTKLYNYQYLQERLTAEFAEAKKCLTPLSLLMIDIDYFQSINDTYGYNFGNEILKQFSELLSTAARQTDIVGRCGAEDFIIILPNTDKQGAIRFANHIQYLIKEHKFKKISSKFNINLNASIGVASFPEDNIKTPSELLDRTAKALTTIKEKESGSVYTYSQFSEPQPDKLTDTKTPFQHAEHLRTKFASLSRKMNQTIIESVYALARTVGARDDYTERHSEEMASYVVKIAQHFKLTPEEIENLKHGAMLHDIGKIGISDRILLKPGKLTPEEFKEVQKHPQIGADIIRQVHFLKDVVPIILHHHERYDGTGYNSGLKGDAIPLSARIVAAVDVYQALTSDRPYRRAYPKEESLKIIEESTGTFFDPKIIEVFMTILQKEKPVRK